MKENYNSNIISLISKRWGAYWSGNFSKEFYKNVENYMKLRPFLVKLRALRLLLF